MCTCVRVRGEVMPGREKLFKVGYANLTDKVKRVKSGRSVKVPGRGAGMR